ncbi:MAG: DNA recombination protein RmuC [Candidatus Nomurabacteria bacterium]|jgi:DNA recombination protein RmuC|nr:DNA recombination protein RmuC [Candidatus Nomurabacteria bacterium]
MEIFLVILMVILVGVVIFTTLKKPPTQKDESIAIIKQDLVALSQSVQKLSEHLGDRLDKNNSLMQNAVGKQLTESSKLVGDVSERLAKLEETNQRVVNVADELKTLQNVLSNPKQRGVFGEFYLETVLQNVLATGQYQTQYKFSDGEIVDAVIFLDKGRILPIDSKFSLENYNRMIETNDKDEKRKLLTKVKLDLKGRIDETSKYIRPSEDTMDFAFMFIPSEALYYDLLINNVGSAGSSRDLIEYAFRDKKVIIVSPTSFMAYLQTVLQGLRSLQIEEQAKEIKERVGKLGVHISNFEEYMAKLGNSLGTTVNHYNNAHKEIEKIDKDVVKITDGESRIEQKRLDKPQDA